MELEVDEAALEVYRVKRQREQMAQILMKDIARLIGIQLDKDIPVEFITIVLTSEEIKLLRETHDIQGGKVIVKRESNSGIESLKISYRTSEK